MQVTILGSGNPLPEVERGGTSVAVTAGEETLLLDCGPKTVHRLVENDIDVTAVEHVFFTHHHIDHNGSFIYFAIITWSIGRDSLTVYGPDGTESLLSALDVVAEKNLESWSKWETLVGTDDPKAGLDDVQYRETTEDLDVRADEWRVTAFPVDHDTELFHPHAYRVEERTSGQSVVFTGDTAKVPDLAEFTAGADVLIHDANALDPDESLLDPADIPDQYLEPPFESFYESYFVEETHDLETKHHSTATDAAEIAARAGVDTLVLTHLNLYRDRETIKENAKARFDGTVRVAEDGLTLSL